jgi:hypothetical protein
MQRLDDWYWVFEHEMPDGFRKPLLDLTAARFLVVEPTRDRTAVLQPPPVPLGEAGGLRVYENPQALPRARFVSSAVVRADDEILSGLADGTLDARTTVALDRAPAAGLPPPGAHGDVSFVTNEADHVVLSVTSDGPGFVVLADQHYPGWQASVNGEPTEILRAHTTFRAVLVPGGAGTVEFRYRPTSFRIGLVVSLVSLIGVALVAWRA